MSNLVPLVSIVIPVYNGSNFLSEAIESALNQTYPNCEIIVVNDGSSDNGLTRDIALGFGDKIRYFEKINGGVSSALNLGIEKMQGVFFSWLSHDDIYSEDKIEFQVHFALANGKKFLYSDYLLLNMDSKEMISPQNRISLSNEDIFFRLIVSFPINGCTTLIRKDLLDEVGFFNNSLKFSQDYDMWFRCALISELFYLKGNVLTSRMHNDQGSKSSGIAHHLECEELFVRMGRSLVNMNSLSTKKTLQIVLSLIHRKFYSSASFYIMNLNSLVLSWIFTLISFVHFTFIKILFFNFFYKGFKILFTKQ